MSADLSGSSDFVQNYADAQQEHIRHGYEIFAAGEGLQLLADAAERQQFQHQQSLQMQALAGQAGTMSPEEYQARANAIMNPQPVASARAPLAAPVLLRVGLVALTLLLLGTLLGAPGTGIVVLAFWVFAAATVVSFIIRRPAQHASR